jgi:hypothetical protein
MFKEDQSGGRVKSRESSEIAESPGSAESAESAVVSFERRAKK